MSNSIPKISVVMSVYNGSFYLRESVESILNQTFADWEFVIIDDASTDTTWKILTDYANQDSRLRLFKNQENLGLTKSLNKGLKLAQSKYIARMDADDISLPERFAKQVTFLDHHPNYVAVGSRVLLIDPDGLPIRPFSEQTTHEAIDAAFMRGQGGAICHPAAMIRGDALQRIGGYREEIKSGQDRDLFLRLAEIGKLANLPETLLKYRMHLKSVGHTRRLEQKQYGYLTLKEAYLRRGLEPPKMLDQDDQHPASTDEIHCKWAWWALSAGNVATARKHALLALSKKPISGANWKVLGCAIRGW